MSTTSQLIRAGEGGLSALLGGAPAQFDFPVQGAAGGASSVPVAPDAFREPSQEHLDPFASSRPLPPNEQWTVNEPASSNAPGAVDDIPLVMGATLLDDRPSPPQATNEPWIVGKLEDD